MVVQTSPPKPTRTAPNYDVGRQISSSNATSSLFLNVPQRSWMANKQAPISNDSTSSHAATNLAHNHTVKTRHTSSVTTAQAQVAQSSITEEQVHKQDLAVTGNEHNSTDPSHKWPGPSPPGETSLASSVQIEHSKSIGAAADRHPQPERELTSRMPVTARPAPQDTAGSQSDLSQPHGQQVATTNSTQSSVQVLTPLASPANTGTEIPQKWACPVGPLIEHQPAHTIGSPTIQPSSSAVHVRLNSNATSSANKRVASGSQPRPVAPVRHDTVPQRLPASTSDSTRPVESTVVRPFSVPAVAGRQSHLVFNLDFKIACMRNRIRFTPVAEMRARWLRDACMHNDRAFLVLHQLFCIWTVQPAVLSTQFAIDTCCDAGFAALQDMFGVQTSLPRELIDFFAGFPYLSQMLASDEELKRCLNLTRDILVQLGQGWVNLRRACLARGYPPSPHEVYILFHCPPNAVLSIAIYTSIEKSINPAGDSHWHNIAYGLYRTVQRSYEQQAVTNSQGAGHVTNHAQIVELFGRQYKTLLMDRHRRAAASAAPPLVSSAQPVVSSSTVYPPSQFHSSNAGGIDPYSRETSSRIPEHYAGPSVSSLANNQAALAPSSRDGGSAAQAGQVITWVPVPAHTVPATARSDISAPPATFNRGVPNTAPTNSYQGHYHILMQKPTGAGNMLDSIDQPRSSLTQHLKTMAANTSGLGRLIPDLENLPHTFVDPLPEQSALHQALAWPPVSRARSTLDGSVSRRYYQFMTSFLAPPEILSPERTFLDINFAVSAELAERRAWTGKAHENSFQQPERFITAGNVLVHLRCILLGDDQDAKEETQWAESTTRYPQHIFASVNDNLLQFRRKRNFRRDLFVDITNTVCSGNNQLTVSYHPVKQEQQQRFAVAIELIELFDEASVVAMPRTIACEEARSAVVAQFEQQPGSDDELSMTVDSLTIELVDPFSSTMIKTPVRGYTCKHRECFDFQNYLNSRTSDEPDVMTSVDKWLCPFCGKDARPSRLIIDGFLLHVRDELEQANNVGARAIVVKSDGSWSVKVEDHQQVSIRAGINKSRGSIDNTKAELGVTVPHAENKSKTEGILSTGPSGAIPATRPDRVIEIIDIDSD